MIDCNRINCVFFYSLRDSLVVYSFSKKSKFGELLDDLLIKFSSRLGLSYKKFVIFNSPIKRQTLDYKVNVHRSRYVVDRMCLSYNPQCIKRI